MQRRLWQGYYDIGMELGGPGPVGIAPVGVAWGRGDRPQPPRALWARDGWHPSPLASYLAACVMYVILTGRDPSGSDYTAGLAPSDARLMQDLAMDILLQWKSGRIEFTQSGAP
jgi:hypothetical protein